MGRFALPAWKMPTDHFVVSFLLARGPAHPQGTVQALSSPPGQRGQQRCSSTSPGLPAL